jgi:hypothetical protein
LEQLVHVMPRLGNGEVACSKSTGMSHVFGTHKFRYDGNYGVAEVKPCKGVVASKDSNDRLRELHAKADGR